ncbi:MAG: hypothetical protein R3C05_06715 [Pirellulaceae bacterium]
MTCTEWFWHAEDNTGGIALNELRELTARLYVRSDDPEDGGNTVINYLISEGFTIAKTYEVGNDVLTSANLYQIDPPQRVATCANFDAVAFQTVRSWRA